ncbi:lipoxygenase [Stachybotrys elegans]|uniref:Manganese lipoxygenase n=1 Tax=Stachybotrys elegans TaxID=80388 RepID=A0A8K0WJH8_9HYPO|nr:lipoxygenase [Stachybotrys elegans]
MLPQDDSNVSARIGEVEQRQTVILYGPSLIGNTSFFPTGTLGSQLSLRDQQQWANDSAFVQQAAAQEAAVVLQAIQEHGGLNTLEDFAVLYDGHWSGSVPLGISQGQLGNLTSDLLFSMERLSVNPYVVQRLHPTNDELPFDVDPEVIQELTASTLASLHREGRLFVADHSYQSEYVAQDGRYSAACTALFYLDSRSNQFLPIAIKTNVGADLIYTPLDDANDWLLAKIMFNVNDLFHGQIYHLANSHAVAEIVYLAALRTLSTRHPVLVLMDRLMFQAYAIRPIGERILFNQGGLFDQNFAFSSEYARVFAQDFYPTVAGPFQRNYFESNLRMRGIIDADYGPELPHIPFYEDGAKIIGVIRDFVTAFVDATYEADDSLLTDWELQAWVAEANGPAEAIDFPETISTKQDLVGILSHLAWLSGVSHHVLNQGDPVATSGVLPLHPASLYSPVPTEKGAIDSVMPWLPDAEKSIEQISLLARFNRPQVVETKQTTEYMFSYPPLLAGTNPAVSAANDAYREGMHLISQGINTRTFDENGLSQGMPFIWRGMDPGVIPFFLSV